ncbi:MAG TPA: DEAD/DEAH box helicase family protein, partial [Steroidobacteraceae bacterium]|nr:DEAD/DEAH box helicase family protein [Steroidobacteraceae bacterium]
MTRAIVRVALDTPLRRLFDYLPGEGESPQPGARVRVPFGRQRLIGVVHSWADASEVPREKLKPLLAVIDDTPVIDAGVMDLIEFAAQYYHHPVGEVMAAALPKLARTGAASRALTECWFASTSGIEALDSAALNRARRQRELLGILRDEPGIAAESLTERLPDWRAPMRALVARGFASSAHVPEEPLAPDTALLRSPGPVLSAEQTAAVAAIDDAAQKFSAFLLHGITGSGKTEVYLHTVERCLRQERRALVLVPEIGLTPQLVARFRERFAVTVAVLHSGLSDVERLAAWRQCVSGAARVVLGTRSAVFAPV